MIWISRGRGGWAVWILILLIVIPLVLDEQLHLIRPSPSAYQWLMLGCMLTAGLITAALGFRLNRGAGRWTVDPASGLQYFDKSARHSLYFIPMQYWGLFYCTLAVTLMAVKH